MSVPSECVTIKLSHELCWWTRNAIHGYSLLAEVGSRLETIFPQLNRGKIFKYFLLG